MRILFVIKSLARGGAEQLLVSTARYLDRAKFQCEVAYLLPESDAFVPALESRGWPCHLLEGRRGGWVNGLTRLARNGDFDVVHVHSPYMAIAARVTLVRQGPHVVYTEHNRWGVYRWATYWGNLLTFPLNEKVLTVSDDVRRSLKYPWPVRFLRMPPASTLYHGVELDQIDEVRGCRDAVRRELGIGPDTPVVGVIANFRPEKAHGDLLEAFASARAAIPDARLVLVGGGPTLVSAKARALSLGLAEETLFLGPRDDAVRIGAAFDVFALASLHEGLSIALIESLALGCPPVVTRIGGNAEVVRDGREGFLVPPGQPAVLADRLITLLRDQPLRREMGARCRSRAADFDMERTVRELEAFYEGVAAPLEGNGTRVHHPRPC